MQSKGGETRKTPGVSGRCSSRSAATLDSTRRRIRRVLSLATRPVRSRRRGMTCPLPSRPAKSATTTRTEDQNGRMSEDRSQTAETSAPSQSEKMRARGRRRGYPFSSENAHHFQFPPVRNPLRFLSSFFRRPPSGRGSASRTKGFFRESARAVRPQLHRCDRVPAERRSPHGREETHHVRRQMQRDRDPDLSASRRR